MHGSMMVLRSSQQVDENEIVSRRCMACLEATVANLIALFHDQYFGKRKPKLLCHILDLGFKRTLRQGFELAKQRRNIMVNVCKKHSQNCHIDTCTYFFKLRLREFLSS